MPLQSTMRTVLATCSVLSLVPQALAHMEMSWPYALHSKYNPANTWNEIDYSMTSPLVADGSNFPCKGYQNDRPIESVITYTAGSTYNMTLAGSATHGGGSCQLSLSYDNGATFRVIQSMIGGCPLQDTYDFTLPSYVPNGDALFAWSWQNLVGNREFYMNCAEVTITGSTAGSATKRDSQYNTFDDLPFIYKANLDGLNDCVTVEGTVPVYPDPGPAVIYGTGASSSSAATSDSGECDAPKPFGQTYEYLSDSVNPTTEVLSVETASNTGAAAATSSKASSTTSTVPSTTLATSTKATTSPSASSTSSKSSTLSTSASTKSSTLSTSSASSTVSTSTKPSTLSTSTKAASTSSISSTLAVSSKSSSSSLSSSSAVISSSKASISTSPATYNVITYSSQGAGRANPTVTSSETCPPDVTIIVYADPSSTSTATLAAASTKSTSVTPSLTGSTVSTVLGFSTAASSSTVIVVSAPTSSSAAAFSTPASSTSSSVGPEVTEGYATGNLATYLPCVPGTYICTTNTTWVTCDQTMYSNGQTAWVYEESRVVAAGTMCMPNVSPYSSANSQYEQQADTVSGYYRDDRIVAAQPYGSCSVDGSIECADGGAEFLMCDHGGWVMMGSVAAGTTCTDGAIVATS